MEFFEVNEVDDDSIKGEIKVKEENNKKKNDFLFACWGSHHSNIVHSNGNKIYLTDYKVIILYLYI
jgi:hypothetical protein